MRSISGATKCSTRNSSSRCSRPNTSTSISMKKSARAPRASAAWPSAGTHASRASSSTNCGPRQPLVLYASHPDFEQTNVVGGMIGEGTGGVTEGLKRRVVLPLAGTLAETDHVLGHELVHAFQYDISAQRAAAGGGSGDGHRSASAVVCRRAGRIPVDRARRSAHGHVAARRHAQGKAAGDRRPRQRRVLSVSLGAGRVGLRRRKVRRRSDRPDFPHRGARRQSDHGARAGARSSTTKSFRPTGTPPSASSMRP